MSIERITAYLAAARDFVEVATAVCQITGEIYEVCQCVVSLHDASGRPLLVVDNLSELADATREALFADAWQRDPLFRLVREHHGTVGDEAMPTDDHQAAARAGRPGDRAHPLLVPILYPGGLLGTIRCGSRTPIGAALRRELTTLGTMVSVHLTHLGVTPDLGAAPRRLTARQRDVAQIAARGMTNAEIAATLSLSENTVKKHLKDIFEELGVANRTGLATMISQAGPAHAYPAGITRAGELTITCALEERVRPRTRRVV